MTPRRSEQGQATVEVVLVLPVVILVLLGVIPAAAVARRQVLVVHAAREAARAAAVDPSLATATRAAAGTSGLDPSRLVVDLTVTRGDDPEVTVRVSYEASTDVALIGPLVADPTLTAEVTMRLEDPGQTS